ncbi:hypothetical protein C0J52_16701 [Blattella germanica]|nr:hypothetical protein C0J52_16701 [Blattella germanica]
MAVGSVSGGKEAHGEVLLLAQEIEFAKVLAGNDKRLRDRGIKKLRKWLTVRSQGNCEFTDDDFLRIWKGLYYCMWMADKLLVQEELAEKISDLVHCFRKRHLAISFIRCFFQTMVLEWYGIDLFRYDKFMMVCLCSLSIATQILGAGFPGESWKDMERIEDDEGMEEQEDVEDEDIFDPSEKEMLKDNPLDPRAGHVNVELPQILFDSHSIAGALEKESENCSNKKCKKTLQTLARQFIELAEGNYFFENSEDYEKMNVPKIEKFKLKKYVRKAAYRLRDFENSKGKNRSRRKKKIRNKNKIPENSEMGKMLEITEDNDKNSMVHVIEGNAVKAEEGSTNESVKNDIEESTIDVIKKNKKKATNSTTKDNVKSAVKPKQSSSSSIRNSLGENINRKKVNLQNVTETTPSSSRKRRSSVSQLEEFVVEPKLKVLKKDVSEGKERKCKGPKETKRNSLCIASDGSESVIKKKKAKNNVKTPGTSLAENSKLNIKSTLNKKTDDIQNNGKKNNTPLVVEGRKSVTLSGSKKVNIALYKNCTQDLRDYHMSVKSSPSIPFDAAKQPSQGVLKPSPIGTRINPFYRLRNKKLLGS